MVSRSSRVLTRYWSSVRNSTSDKYWMNSGENCDIVDDEEEQKGCRLKALSQFTFSSAVKVFPVREFSETANFRSFGVSEFRSFEDTVP
jgi:hypothetical protein